MPGRGRGGGRGRRRGRGRWRGHGRGQSQSPEEDNKDQWAEETEIDVNTDVKALFVGQATFDQHYKGQEENRTRYAAAISVFQDTGLEISQNASVRALAAAWARRDHELADALLENRSTFGLVEVLKAASFLDAGRQIRAVEKAMMRLQMQKVKVKPKQLGKLKSTIDNLTAIKPKVGSASGAVCKRIKKWTTKFTKDELEFFALFYQAEPWKRLADIVHFNPEKDFPAMPWFLSYCFGKPAPDDSMVAHCKDITVENVNDLLKEYDIPYSHIKQHTAALTTESKVKLANVEKLDNLIWYYKDLQGPEVDAILDRRLEAGEKVTLNNGKLLERLLTIKMIREEIPFRSAHYWPNQETLKNLTKAPFLHRLIPVAQERIDKISLQLEAPIVVMGDRSGSMQVAIRTSTILASMLTAIAKARLVFFSDHNLEIPLEGMPHDIESILKMAVTFKAGGVTAPAASLYPFYESKQQIKTFIVVTDEGENKRFNGDSFAALYKKYHDEVYPAKLVFVSFLRSQHTKGNMVRDLETLGFNPIQFKLDGNQPDLAKLDNLFGLLSSESTLTFEETLKAKESAITAEGILKIFQAQAASGQTADTK